MLNHTSTQQLHNRVAGLESQVDLMESELIHLNELLVASGFPEGIKTLKEIMNEFLAEDNSDHPHSA